MSTPPYIGVSGFMSSPEVRAALDAFPDCGRQLMVGVLASSKTIGGGSNRYPRRYPRATAIGDIFVNDARCLNLVHYATGGERDVEALAQALDLAFMLGGPNCHGLQVNGGWPPFEALRIFRMRHRKSRVVFQVETAGDAATDALCVEVIEASFLEQP